MGAPEPALLLTCEHGGNRVPPDCRALFRGQRRRLASHRGWDPGALLVARALARGLRAPLLASTTTRLLVDLNRSPDNPAVFSDIARRLPRARREVLLTRYHWPHWNAVRREIARLARGRGCVLHVAVHSFAPVLAGRRRDYEIGLLYDPRSVPERCFARDWQRRLRAGPPPLRVRRNAPYRGDADGLTRALRRQFGPARYLGIELELNQRDVADAGARRRLADAVAASLSAARGAAGR